ncbi:BspA family leucine-rich repeat surface protein, partial [Maribacter sp.]|nr:BspA family leucine-rich repeat surface protein [Maribacter sp.]
MKQITLLFSFFLFIFSTNAQDCLPTSTLWTSVDIGAVALAGSSCHDVAQNTFEVTASGADIWGTNDEFHYVYQELAGDGEIVARVDGLTNTHPWAKAGVMMRNSTDADAAQILMSLSTNPKNVGVAYSLQDRLSKGAAMNDNLNNIGPVPVGGFPYYVRLVREGSNFKGYASATNGDWALVGTKTIPMNETILVGLATTSHRDGTATTATYSEVEVEEASLTDMTPFITTWKTDNPGTSEDNQITISTNDGAFTPYNYDYNYTVHWGDGSSDTGVLGDITHTYATAGTYAVSITGDFPRIYFEPDFRGNYDSGKLLSVEQWGDIEWLSMEFAFDSCENLDVKATDFPNLSNVQNMAGMFQGCSSLIGNPTFNEWDVSNVTDMNSMFNGATDFNQDIGNWEVGNVQSLDRMFQIASSFNQDVGNWDVGNTKYMYAMFFEASAFDQDLGSWNVTEVINMSGMFGDAGLSTENYDSLLMGWSAQPLQSEIVFNGGYSQYCEADEARQKLIDDFGWSITDGGKSADCEDSQRPFITTWKTDNTGFNYNQITIPTFSGENYNYLVDWGDGAVNTNVTGNITHTYAVPGTYQVSISGDFPRIYFNDHSAEIPSTNKIIEVVQWGDIKWTSMERAFYGTSNLEITAEDVPNLSDVNSLQRMFQNSGLVGNESLNQWDVSNITDMFFVFIGANNFNAPIGNWDVSKVSTMFSMFSGAEAFDQDISDWNVSNVTNMYSMFGGAKSFNQPIGSWDVSKVTNIRYMFKGASVFNQNLGSWDVSQVTTMESTFSESGLSNENYDDILIGWSRLPSLKNNVLLKAPSNQYCEAKEARQYIVDTYNWTIYDGGQEENCAVGLSDFTIVDAQTGNTLSRISDGEVLYTDLFEDRPIDFVFLGPSGFESVSFILTGEVESQNVDSEVPFLLHDGEAMVLESGNYTLSATPYSNENAMGQAGETRTISFSIVEQRPFKTTWKTDEAGVSTNNQITIPTRFQDDYNYTVDWGDGTINSKVSGNITHTYDIPGVYIVSIYGLFPRLRPGGGFGETDKEKLLYVNQWGDIQWENFNGQFNGCTNLDILAMDIPDLSQVKSLAAAFTNCSNLMGNLTFNDWNTGNVEDFSYMFFGASKFNQPIGSWDL